MNLIRLLLHTSWSSLALAVFAGLTSGGSAAALIALINTTLSSVKPSIVTLVWSFTALCLLRLITSFASQVLLIRLSEGAILNLRMLLSRRILASPLRQLEEIGAPCLLATLTDDIQSVSNTVFIIPPITINIAIVAGCLSYMCWLSWFVFLITFGLMILGIISYQLLQTRALAFLKLAREQQDRLFKHFRAITEGIKELKLHRQRRQQFLYEELQLTALSSQNHNIDGMTIYAAAGSWGQLLFFVAIGLVLFVLPSFQVVKISILSGYVLTILYLTSPLEDIMGRLPHFSRATIALKKIESLGLSLTTDSDKIELDVQPPGLDPSWQRLELLGVTHVYRGEQEESGFIFGPVNLALQHGDLVFIVGGNGSGKSTLAKLITGLYIPEAGEIRVDGQPITNHNREWYRQQFSVVFSDFYLFESLLGLRNSNLDTTTRDHLIQLQLDHKVQVKDGVLSTTALSQGQRKRLALLTAYLENRPIYVFDEWASDQDPTFREIFYKQLVPQLRDRGKTVLVISHDDRYFHLANRIVKLDYGKLEEDVPTLLID